MNPIPIYENRNRVGQVIPVQENNNSILILPDEHIYLAKRKHWFTVFVPIFLTVLFGVFFIALSATLLINFYFNSLLLLGLILLTSAILLTAVSKLLIDWYFHFYLVTNKKIVEISCYPMFSADMNDILLNQVKCTEIDIKTAGFISEMLDMGDVVITFDRPTKREEFRLSDIKNPREAGTYLGEILSSIAHDDGTTIWYRTRNDRSHFRFIEEVFPKRIGLKNYG